MASSLAYLLSTYAGHSFVVHLYRIVWHILSSLSFRCSRGMDDRMNDVQVMKATVLVMQRGTDNVRKIIARLLQVSTIMERLQRISVDLETVLKQLELRETPTQHPASQSKLTMQELYRRQAAFERHRKKFEKENGNRHMEHRTDDTAEDEIDCE